VRRSFVASCWRLCLLLHAPSSASRPSPHGGVVLCPRMLRPSHIGLPARRSGGARFGKEIVSTSERVGPGSYSQAEPKKRGTSAAGSAAFASTVLREPLFNVL
jgi:hypothetical protein